MSPSSADLLRQVKSEIDEVDPSEVKELLQEGVAIVDLRETDEISSGLLPGAKHVPRGYLESRIEAIVPDREAHVILYCASGNRSAYGARTLRDDLGYEHVQSMTGGITLWKDRGYEVDVPRTLSCCSAPAASARRPRSTSQPPASARSGSSMTTTWTSRTSSAR